PFDVPAAGAEDPPEDLKKAAAHEAEPVLDPPLAVVSQAPPKGPPPPNTELDPEVLAKVKRATVLLKVTMGDDQKGQGSGFFGVEKGIVLTNAHVLGMLQPGAKKPRKIEVVLNSGQPDEKTVPGTFLGVDRSSDLGLLRVDLPEPPPP